MARITMVHWRLVNGAPHVKFPFDRIRIDRLKEAIGYRERSWNGYLKAWKIDPNSVEVAHRILAGLPLCARCLNRDSCVVWPPPEPKPVAPDYTEDDWRDLRGFRYSDGSVQDW